MAHILIVDDDQQVREAIERLLRRSGHACATADGPAAARKALDAERFDLVLLDVVMPGGSGLDVLGEVTADSPDTAVVIVTGVDDRAAAAAAIDLGAFGYVLKPFASNELEIAVLNALRRRDLERERRHLLRELGEKLSERAVTLREACRDLAQRVEEGRAWEARVLDRVGRAFSLRDDETGPHLERVGRIAELLAGRLGVEGVAPEELRVAAALHDAGKLGVPDDLLRKPGPLDPEGRAVVRRHPHIGYRLLADSGSRVLDLATSVALTHHERWDGGGYPRGLRGEAIPPEGRIAAVADAFDAMTHRRPFREALAREEALRILQEERWRHFDGDVVDTLLALRDDVWAILDELPDEEDRRTTVLLVDDHMLFAEALVSYLEASEDIVALGVADSVASARRMARDLRPDVVLLDHSLPDGNGVEAIRLLKAELPSAKIVMLTGGADAGVLAGAVRAGCAGYLVKGGRPGEIEEAVRRVQRGETVIPGGVLSPVAEQVEAAPGGLGAAISARERQVLQLLAEGCTMDEITARLALSRHTVADHVRRVIEKLDAHSGLEAVATAVREGVIDLSHG